MTPMPLRKVSFTTRVASTRALGSTDNPRCAKSIPPTAGTFTTTSPIFVVLLIGVILIVGALTFFPADALGPIVEHLLMLKGKTF